MKSLLTVAIALCLAPIVRAEDENPFKKANVKDSVEYKLVTTTNNITLTGTMKMTVTSKTDTEARVATTVTINGQEASTQESKIDLTMPFDPTSATGLPLLADVKAEKSANEKITVGGKEYDCTTTKLKLNAKVMGQDFESDVKTWVSKTVPMTNLVKMEVKSRLADMTIEYMPQTPK